MDQPKNQQIVSAVVATYNEGVRIGRVLEVLTRSPHLSEVIVVDDGSDDATEQIVAGYNVHYLKNERNYGKGYTLNRGVQAARGDIIFFCDADVSGLTPEMIAQILTPVLNGNAEMFIAVRARWETVLPFFFNIVPLIGGERAVTRGLWERLPHFYKKNFRVETGLNFYARYNGRGYQYQVCRGLTQTIKENKYGLVKGTQQRWRMNADLLTAHWETLWPDTIGMWITGRFSGKRALGLGLKLFLYNSFLSLAIIGSGSYLTCRAALIHGGKRIIPFYNGNK